MDEEEQKEELECEFKNEAECEEELDESGLDTEEPHEEGVEID